MYLYTAQYLTKNTPIINNGSTYDYICKWIVINLCYFKPHQDIKNVSLTWRSVQTWLPQKNKKLKVLVSTEKVCCL